MLPSKTAVGGCTAATRIAAKGFRFRRPKVAVDGRGTAVPVVLGIMAGCLLMELACAAIIFCNAKHGGGVATPSAWLVVYPTLGLVFICIMCITWVRRRQNTARKFADAVLSDKPPDNILTLRAALVVLFTIWSLCLIASLPNWEKWVGIADATACCLPVVVLLLLLFGLFFEEVSAYPPREMWTMPIIADSTPIKDGSTGASQTYNHADREVPSNIDAELIAPTVYTMERRSESSEALTLRMLYPLEGYLQDSSLRL
ncbi:major surface protein 1a-like protein 3 [Anaplasma centrale str. Israel]|uniref:Major surface protein 1a-like protein 3 n=1 Tax=Anaplasma centrale (strain Israel) TaxID=574556 RepID=D1AS68_ANACI|nr:hypothetical protein [Anaplasma centrale]ACZ49321.1 major surface protein 1a-like protein 3 [Anaplasma centrale str. Israel]